ncbi:hypothetical protein M2323_002732 [Rhodoblastus acidophilus]|uniref:hypothetical protein n=1 Tax=Rhodoblastus acidophilus TaxID=1074 RepID=UPI002224AEF3|nr:hypothetical protein [Rhodoblastus acidophilus]MCW2284914.1 hypothetical protein [Rhodoblastus acidophilus]MCW2333796.1 hypothetical protein [Rhodoblastus acidophilus]
MKESGTVTASIRLPAELMALIRAEAERQNRSINFLMVDALKRAFLADSQPTKPKKSTWNQEAMRRVLQIVEDALESAKAEVEAAQKAQSTKPKPTKASATKARAKPVK